MLCVLVWGCCGGCVFVFFVGFSTKFVKCIGKDILLKSGFCITTEYININNSNKSPMVDKRHQPPRSQDFWAEELWGKDNRFVLRDRKGRIVTWRKTTIDNLKDLNNELALTNKLKPNVERVVIGVKKPVIEWAVLNGIRSTVPQSKTDSGRVQKKLYMVRASIKIKGKRTLVVGKSQQVSINSSNEGIEREAWENFYQVLDGHWHNLDGSGDTDNGEKIFKRIKKKMTSDDLNVEEGLMFYESS